MSDVRAKQLWETSLFSFAKSNQSQETLKLLDYPKLDIYA